MSPSAPGSVRPRRDSGRDWVLGGLVFVLAMAIYASPPGLGRPFRNGDEAIYAEMAREMASGSGLFTLRWQGQPILNRPPAAVWALALSARLMGPGERALRGIVAAQAAAAAALLFLYGARRYGAVAGLGAALLFATADRVFVYARYIESEPLLVLLLVASGLCWEKSRERRAFAAGFGVCLGLSLLTKQVVGALPLLFPALDLALRRPLPWRAMGGALLLAAAIVLPWHLWESARFGSAFWHEYLVANVAARAGAAMHHPTTPLFYPRMLWRTEGLLVLLYAAGLAYACWRRDPVPLGWALAVLLPLSIAGSRYDYYALVAYPALALGAGRLLGEAVPRLGWVLGPAAAVASLVHTLGARHAEETPWDAQVKGLAELCAQVSRPGDLVLSINQFAFAPRFYSQREAIMVTLDPVTDPGQSLLPGEQVPLGGLLPRLERRPRWFALAQKRDAPRLGPLGTVYLVGESRDYVLVAHQPGP